jgi:tetratricopeptide (TPR) repeat protein
MIRMANLQHGINPLLIAALTGQAVTDIPQNPVPSSLPGKLVKSIIKNKKRMDPPAASNNENLICGHCGRQGKYDLGLIAFKMERWEKEANASLDKPNYEAALDYIQTTGYIRCKGCNGGGDWKFKDPMFTFGLLARVLAGGINNEMDDAAGIMLGELQLYDGSMHQWATDSEEAFLTKLIDNSSDGLMWNKLGNLYLRGGRPELAAAAFEKSIQEDPTQVESHYSLGSLLYQIRELDQSAYHGRMMLVHASRYEALDAIKLRELLSACLQDLFELHRGTNERIPFLPTKEELSLLPAYRESVSSKESYVLDLQDVEIFPRQRESFYPIAEMYMQHRSSELPESERTREKLLDKHSKRISPVSEEFPANRGLISNGSLLQIKAGTEERAARLTKLCERFQLNCSVEVGSPENLRHLESALGSKLSLSNVYAPCPCNSGSKFKFCCARKMKNMNIELFIEEFGNL